MLGRTLLENTHDIAQGLHKAGIIDTVTMREYDALCLPPVKELSSKEIKQLRIREKVSQLVFAKILNTSPATVKQWERGERHPRGIVLKVLNLVTDSGLGILGYQQRTVN